MNRITFDHNEREVLLNALDLLLDDLYGDEDDPDIAVVLALKERISR